MISTYFDLDDTRLPTDVITLEQAQEKVDDPTLSETIELALDNGYVLCSMEEWGYRLEKLEVEE